MKILKLFMMPFVKEPKNQVSIDYLFITMPRRDSACKLRTERLSTLSALFSLLVSSRVIRAIWEQVSSIRVSSSLQRRLFSTQFLQLTTIFSFLEYKLDCIFIAHQKCGSQKLLRQGYDPVVFRDRPSASGRPVMVNHSGWGIFLPSHFNFQDIQASRQWSHMADTHLV